MAEYLAENSRLRQLSRRYAEGALPFAEYRAGRREILEALEAGKIAADTAVSEEVLEVETAFNSTDMRLPDDSAVFYKTMPPHAALVATEDSAETGAVAPSPSWDSNAQVLAIVLGIALVIALGALIYVFVL